MKKLEGKIALITGSSRGIGYAIAERFIEEGAKVAIAGSREETAMKAYNKLSEKYKDAEIIPVWADVRNSDEVASMFKKVVDKWQGLDICVNNAGISITKPITNMTDEDFLDVLDVNLNGVFRCTREAAKIMKDNMSGSIINTSSMVSINGSPNQSAYTSSKFAVNGLTRSNARELGKFGIRVNAVAPGVVGTDLVVEHVTEEMLKGLQMVTALARYAEPRELAGAYVYLASEDSSFTTGAILDVNGGIVN